MLTRFLVPFVIVTVACGAESTSSQSSAITTPHDRFVLVLDGAPVGVIDDVRDQSLFSGDATVIDAQASSETEQAYSRRASEKESSV